MEICFRCTTTTSIKYYFLVNDHLCNINDFKYLGLVPLLTVVKNASYSRNWKSYNRSKYFQIFCARNIKN